jgi:nitrite reductase/ring-hydroxylating ferredoxin subunit
MRRLPLKFMARRYYAVDRRCGHMNGPLEMGALDGTIVTCLMHDVQFDATTGYALNYRSLNTSTSHFQVDGRVGE